MEFSNRSGLITHALFCLQNKKKLLWRNRYELIGFTLEP